MKNIAKHLLCMVLMLVLPVSVQAARGYCMVCEGSYSYTEEYTEWTDEEHNIRHWCDNCGEDQYGGTLAEEHEIEHYSSRYDECTKCGYRIDCEHVCDHDITYTEWDDCDWYEYCVECDELVDEGTEHGDYEYDDWEYYSASRHRRYYYCENCGGDDGYDYGYHDEEIEYYEYDEDQHEVVEYCADCDSNISEDYEDHSFSYGSWSNYSGSQHRRSVYCSDCGYSDYEYAGHSLTYGEWTSYSSTQHKRTVSCSGCSYSITEYANHSLTYGNWASYDEDQHRRSASCSCGYSGYVYEDHEHTTIAGMEEQDDIQHLVLYRCSCGHILDEPEDHTPEYTDWTVYSEEEHYREISCDCGYTSLEFGGHTDGDNDGECDVCSYLTARFSVTVPAFMTIVVSENGEVYTADNIEIVNHSTGTVEITDIRVASSADWTLVPYDTNMADEKVDSRQIGFLLNGTDGMMENLSLTGDWTVEKNTAFPLIYDAVVSATSESINGEQVLTVTFVVEWA